VCFNSDFDQGNLWKCLRPEKFEFELWTAPDSLPYNDHSSYRTWFYFCVQGAHNLGGEPVSFKVNNLNN